MARALYQKLGIKEDHHICVINPPTGFERLFTDVPFGLEWLPLTNGLNFIHFFPENFSELEELLPRLQDLIHRDGMIWVSWHKKASKIPTDINESLIRDTALGLKLVDVKVCSINDQYSALKLVIRKHLR